MKNQHRFEKTWKSKEKPNSQRDFPTLSFRTNNLDPEVLNYLLGLQEKGEMSKFICSAIQTRHFIEFSPTSFINNLVEQYYDKVRFILRKVGRERNKYKSLDNNKTKHL